MMMMIIEMNILSLDDITKECLCLVFYWQQKKQQQQRQQPPGGSTHSLWSDALSHVTGLLQDIDFYLKAEVKMSVLL